MDTDTLHRLALKIARKLHVSIAHAKAVAELHYTPRAAR